MRTTITLSDETSEIVMRYAESCGLSFSKAVSELILRNDRKPRIKYVDGLPVFDLPKASRPITTRDVKALEAEEL